MGHILPQQGITLATANVAAPNNHAEYLSDRMGMMQRGHAGYLEECPVDNIERRDPMMARWSEHIQEAATGNLSVSAIRENRDRKVVSIR